MDECKGLYSNFYQANSTIESETLADSFLRNVFIPKLSEIQKGKCEENMIVGECFTTLKSFITPGNDDLGVEFYFLLPFGLFLENIQ